MNGFDHASPNLIDLIANLGEFPDGCDPDFDADIELLEREFAELCLRSTRTDQEGAST